MKLDVRATAPINARNEKIQLAFDAGEITSLEMPVPASTPVTWLAVNALELELSDCNAFEFVVHMREGTGPRIRVRIRTGSGCDVAIRLDGESFAHVGPNADQTFVQNC
ncbi:MAG: hypothetical protein MUF07_05450 [Steroidobacteraceae bacterium]|nr:hypothetical protein [Steroidobacteraceae bacterium]